MPQPSSLASEFPPPSESPSPALNAGKDQALPFADLTPDVLLSALESIDLMPDGRLLALNSYENRVYQIGFEGNPLRIVKFYRPGRWSDAAIQEEHDFALELAEREIPVVPPLQIGGRTLHQHEGLRFALFEKIGGRAPELEDDATLQWMGRFLGRIHAVGALHPYQARPSLDIQSFGYDARDRLLASGRIPADVLESWRSTVEVVLQRVEACFARAGHYTALRLHGDCHAGNVLWSETCQPPGPYFVDLDDSRMGPAIQDLWMMLAGSRADMSRQLCEILAGYEDFHEFDHRELHLIEALRSLRLIHYSAWLAQRWADPAFPAAFPWFNTQRYWEDRILELREQIALMDEGPLWPA